MRGAHLGKTECAWSSALSRWVCAEYDLGLNKCHTAFGKGPLCMPCGPHVLPAPTLGASLLHVHGSEQRVSWGRVRLRCSDARAEPCPHALSFPVCGPQRSGVCTRHLCLRPAGVPQQEECVAASCVLREEPWHQVRGGLVASVLTGPPAAGCAELPLVGEGLATGAVPVAPWAIGTSLSRS